MTHTTNNHTFEIVTEIPKGYSIWNIGRHMQSNTLIPLCKCYKGTYDVQTDCLKAIEVPVDRWAEIMKLAHRSSRRSMQLLKEVLGV